MPSQPHSGQFLPPPVSRAFTLVSRLIATVLLLSYFHFRAPRELSCFFAADLFHEHQQPPHEWFVLFSPVLPVGALKVFAHRPKFWRTHTRESLPENSLRLSLLCLLPEFGLLLETAC